MLKINNLLNKTTFVLTVALRFFIGIRKNLYSTYITVVAIFALGLGVSIVTVVLGAINGFENEISKNTIQISGHAILFPKSPKAGWRNNRDILENQKAVESISSFIRTEALISYGIKTVPVSFEGISTDSNKEFLSQKFNFLKKNKSHSLGVDVVFLGNQLAERLGVKVGEQVTILIPQLKPQKSPEIISVSVKIGDIFSVGLYDIDSNCSH